MRKMLIIGFLVCVVAIAIIFALALANANSLIARYKGELERVVSEVLGTKVSIGEVKAYVMPNTRFELRGLEIGESDDLILGSAGLHMKLWPLVKKQLSIEELSFENPRISLVKDEQGIYVKGLPVKSKEKKTAEADSLAQARAQAQGDRAQAQEDEAPSAAKEQELHPKDLLVQLKSFSLRGGEINFEDRITQKTYAFTDGNLAARLEMDAKTIRIPDFVLKGRLFNETELSFSGGGISYDISEKKVEIGKAIFHLPESSLSLEAASDLNTGSGKLLIGPGKISLGGLIPLLKNFAPTIEQNAPTGMLETAGQAEFSKGGISSASVGLVAKDIGAVLKGFNLAKLNGNFQFTGDSEKKAVRIEPLQFALNGSPMAFDGLIDVLGDDVQLRKAELQAFSGKASMQGSLSLVAPALLRSSLKVNDMSLGSMFQAFAPGVANIVTITGTLKDLHFDSTAQLRTDPKRTLKGKGAFEAVNGSLKAVNILGSVLEAVNNLPFMQGSLMANVPPEQGKAIRSSDTNFSLLRLDFSVADGWMNLQGARLRSDLFALNADGKISLEGDMDLKASIILSAELSHGLASRVKEIQKVLAADGTLTIPLSIKGKGANLIILPDVKGMMRIGAGRVIAEKAGSLLGDTGKGIGKLLGF